MNLLQKQGFFNSIILYLGIALGFFNSIILFQRVLTLEEIGYFGLLTTLSVFFNQLSSLGFQSVITRYFPFFKTSDRRHGGFPRFVLLASMGGFAMVTICFLLFKELVFDFYQKNTGSSLMGQYYYFIIPVSFVTLFFLIQEALARTAYKSVVPAFLREVMLKVFTTIGVVMVMVQWIDFLGFIKYYLAANVFILLAIILYVRKVKIYDPAPVSLEVKSRAREMLNYGLFSMVSGSAVALIPSLGLIVLKMLSGEHIVGVYVTLSVIATVISLPAKALNATSYQLIADAWKNEDLNKIGKIYHKTSVIQLIIGALLLVGLIINQRNLLFLLHKPEYVNYFNVFIVLGCGFLLDITGGLNQAIISFSKYYKVIMRFLLVAVACSFGINFMLISNMGLLGAAWSYLITMFLLNFGYWLYLKLKFDLQPFGKKHLYVVGISLIVLGLGWFLPNLANYYFDVLYRSAIVSFIYGIMVYYTKVSEDINDLVDKVLMRK